MVVGEPGKTRPVEVDSQRVIARTEDIDSHIEFAASQEHRVQDVSLADIVLNADFFVGPLPFVDVCYFVEDEDSLSLAFRCLG